MPDPADKFAKKPKSAAQCKAEYDVLAATVKTMAAAQVKLRHELTAKLNAEAKKQAGDLTEKMEQKRQAHIAWQEAIQREAAPAIAAAQEKTRKDEQLRKAVPSIVTPQNPIDLTARDTANKPKQPPTP